MFTTQKKRTRARTYPIALGAAMILVVAACGGDDSNGESDAADSDGDGDSEEIELELWLQRDEYMATDDFAQFEADNPGITVRAVTVAAEEQIAAFLRGAAGEDTPDVLMPTTDLWPPLAEEGLLYDMADQLEQWEQEDPEGFANASTGIAFGTAGDGVTYGVGMTGAPTWMTYRVDLFEDAGIAVPTTYDELLDAARVIQAEYPEIVPWGIVGGRSASPAAKFLTLFYLMGGQHVDGVPQFDSEAGVYLLELYQTLMREGLAHPDTLNWISDETRGNLIEGNEGMTMISENIYPPLNEALEYGSEWGILPILTREGQSEDPMMTFRAVTAVIAGDTEYPDAAAKLVRYLAGPDYGLDVSVRYQPSLNAAVKSEPEYQDVAPWAEDLAPFWDIAQPLPAHSTSRELYEVIHDMKQEAIANPDADAAEIASNAQAALNDIAGQ